MVIFYRALNKPVNDIANAFEISVYIMIAETKYRKAKLLQVFSARCVVSCVFRLKVLGAIDFYNEFSTCTIEIHNIPAKLLLSAKGMRIEF